MIRYMSKCNGCAECVHCGRAFEQFEFVSCDACGEEGLDRYYVYEGEEYCEECMKDKLLEEAIRIGDVKFEC